MLIGKDRATLLSLLALTDSDRDGEALAALRKAQAILRRHGLRLADVPGPPMAQPIPEAACVRRARPASRTSRPATGMDWSALGPVPLGFSRPHACAMLDEMVDGSFAADPGTRWIPSFCSSLARSLRRYDRLTQGQWEALRKIYARHGSQPVI